MNFCEGAWVIDIGYIEHLQQNTWFSHLPMPFQEFVIQHSKQKWIEKNTAVFHAQDLFDDIHGNERIAAIAEPIMWFGEISLIDQQPRSHDAIALKKSLVLHIPAEPLKQLLIQQPTYWYYFALLTSQKLRYLFLEKIAIQTQKMAQRLAQKLLFILEGYGNRRSIQDFIIHISQDQLANMVTVSRQTVNQELNLLEKQAIIDVGFKKIVILDFEKLKKLANLDE